MKIVKEQGAIGMDNFLLVSWTNAWRQSQQHYISKKNHKQDAGAWSEKSQTIMWEYAAQMWKNRNQVVHGDQLGKGSKWIQKNLKESKI